MRSLSAWRAWIEIIRTNTVIRRCLLSLSAWRAWIEIIVCDLCGQYGIGRSPLGERGLKWYLSNPAFRYQPTSLSAWRAWIEICRLSNYKCVRRVALRLESVDWNRPNQTRVIINNTVALRLESVDWNRTALLVLVACNGRSPLGERGLKSLPRYAHPPPAVSLSAWRAWIEISCSQLFSSEYQVAFRLESVDWNTKNFGRGTTYILSLSVWRAWIKIATIIIFARLQSAFFRLEDLDWNMFW